MSHSFRSSNRIVSRILICVIILIAYVLFLVMSSYKFSTNPANETIPTVSYCELVHTPERYDQVIVRVHATYVVGFEWSYLMDRNCTEQTWTLFISEDKTCSVNLPRPLFPPKRNGGRWKVSVVGQFFSERGNYGHLGYYPFEFNVVCIESASLFIPWNWP
ncbi:MAG: hypothetical protein H7Y59_03625 [Anaerolineales bacterium]|nr:hypothetical protein [Anaerolineales bacterium]